MQDPPAMVDVYYCELRRTPEPITEPVTKIGGAPVFLQPAEWPTCKECGQPMQFLAQLRLDKPLPLSDRYAMAYVFMCDTCIESAEPGAGANAVILQMLTSRAASQAPPEQRPEYLPDYVLKMEWG